MSSALSELAGFAAQRALPAHVVEKAKACVLYAAAVGIACLRSPQAAQAAAASPPSTGKATRFLDNTKCDPAGAAFANATLFHARVQEDAHAAGHVGVVVVPTALAMAETTGASGADLLSAVAMGYETALRIGRDHAADLSARGFRTTPAYGVFGAAAAAGRLMGFSAQTMTHALGLAANMAGGLREFAAAGSEDFAFQAGTAAANGITAARLAAAGAGSSPSVLEGEAGFYRAFGETGRRYAARLAAGLGTEFEIMGVTYKPYPICQFHRGIVRGCLELRSRARRAPLASLTIRMNPFEADFFGVRFAGPFRSFPQTFMSAPFCASLAWARGSVTLAGLTDFEDADVLALVPRVTVLSDKQRARYSPLVQARLADDTRLEWEERERADAYLLTWDTARRMTATLAAEAGVSAAAAERLIAEVERLDGARDVEALVGALSSSIEERCTSGSGAAGP